MDKKKLDEIQKLAGNLAKVAAFLPATSQLQVIRKAKIIEDAEMIKELAASIKDQE